MAKILVNLGIATIAWWAVGYGIASLARQQDLRHGRILLPPRPGQSTACAVGGTDTALMLFGMLFCAVSLAIVWGTTLERIKFGAYVIYAVVFAAIIYPLVAHGVYGGGLLADVGGKPVMDFAGSSVVHLTGAVGGLAALLLLGARKGKYGRDGKPRAIPGHSMPIAGLGVLILWVGWYGFNAGSTFGTAAASCFAEVALNTQLAAAAGALAAMGTIYAKTKVARRRHGRQRCDRGTRRDHGSVRIRRVLGRLRSSARSAAWSSCSASSRSTSSLDDPVGALSAHGLAGIWGTLSVGMFGSSRLILDGASPGVWYGITDGGFAASLGQLGVQAVGVAATFLLVFVLSYAHVRRDQGDDRAPRIGGGGGGRAGHRLTRHVRIPGAVHPGRRSSGSRA